VLYGEIGGLSLVYLIRLLLLLFIRRGVVLDCEVGGVDDDVLLMMMHSKCLLR
jgi:hypothetical protein